MVTTDLFAFDDSTDFYKLQGLGRACDMGDSMVGYAMQACSGVDWYAVRNASDPQIPNPDGDINAANPQSRPDLCRVGRVYDGGERDRHLGHHRRTVQSPVSRQQ